MAAARAAAETRCSVDASALLRTVLQFPPHRPPLSADAAAPPTGGADPDNGTGLPQPPLPMGRGIHLVPPTPPPPARPGLPMLVPRTITPSPAPPTNSHASGRLAEQPPPMWRPSRRKRDEGERNRTWQRRPTREPRQTPPPPTPHPPWPGPAVAAASLFAAIEARCRVHVRRPATRASHRTHSTGNPPVSRPSSTTTAGGGTLRGRHDPPHAASAHRQRPQQHPSAQHDHRKTQHRPRDRPPCRRRQARG